MKYLWIAAGLFMSQIVCADKVKDHMVLVKAEDQEMNAAIQRAQSTLDDFLKVFAKPPKGATGFKLKVKISYANGKEHMWVTPFKRDGTSFVGILADEPMYVTSVKNGDVIRFTRSDISDWGYVLDGKQQGSYTVCVLFKHMAPAEVQKYRADYGFECK